MDHKSKACKKIKAGIQASLTVEASLALPLFMFFCIQLMSVISVIQLHSVIEAAMHQEVAAASLNAYTIDTALGNTGVIGDKATDAYLMGKVIDRAGKDYLDKSMIVGGSGGIRMALSPDTPGQDTVDLALYYQVKPVVDILGFSQFTMGNRVRMKKWTGYKADLAAESTGDEELVYVTENGTVYHKNRNCTHIMLSIETVSRGAIESLRNNGGGKYHSCELCGSKAGKNVFITGEGNKYHSSLGCSGLKRTVYVVRKSEVGGKGACSRCGG